MTLTESRLSVTAYAYAMEVELDVSYLCNREALVVAAERGLTIGKYADPVDGSREGLTVDEAADVAACDPSLVYIVTA